LLCLTLHLIKNLIEPVTDLKHRLVMLVLMSVVVV
jgi:hypothetical protein